MAVTVAMRALLMVTSIRSYRASRTGGGNRIVRPRSNIRAPHGTTGPCVRDRSLRTHSPDVPEPAAMLSVSWAALPEDIGGLQMRWKSFVAMAAVPVLGIGIAGCAAPSTEAETGTTSAAELVDVGDYLLYEEDPENMDDWYTASAAKDGFVETDSGSYYSWWVPSPEEDGASMFTDTVWNSGSDTYKQELQQAGYTEADVFEARHLAYQMIQIAFDSEMVDKSLSDSERAEWVTAVSANIPLSDEVQSLMSQNNTQVVLLGFKDGVGQLPTLIQDGVPRSVTTTGFLATPSGFTLKDSGNGPFMDAAFNVDIAYRVSDESMRAYLETQGASNIPQDILGDGVGTNLLHVRGTYNVAVQKQPDGSLQIVGLQDTYEISTDF